MCVCVCVHVCVCVCVVCVWVCSKPGYAALSVNILELRELLVVLVPQLIEKVLCLVYVPCTFGFEIAWGIFRIPPFLFECGCHSYYPTNRIYDHNWIMWFCMVHPGIGSRSFCHIVVVCRFGDRRTMTSWWRDWRGRCHTRTTCEGFMITLSLCWPHSHRTCSQTRSVATLRNCDGDYCQGKYHDVTSR